MTGDRPMAPGRIFCRECGDHHVPGDHDEGIVLPDPPSLYWACSALHMAHMGTADPMPETTVRQTRAFIQRKLDGWYDQRKSHEYDEAVRALCLAALKETAPAAPEEMEERACYHCDAPIMVPAGSPRIHTCGKCENSAPDLSKVLAPSIPEEPTSPIVDPKAARQKEEIEEVKAEANRLIGENDYLAAEVLRLTKERDEWKGRADQNETVALADAYQCEREVRASAKALREALAEIVTHVDPDRMRVVAYAALAPPNPSAEKLTPGPRE